MDKIYKKYQGHTIENGFSETSPDFKKFASYVKKRMKIAAADRGIVLEDFIVGHYFISGFFRKNEKWAYFSFDECRNSPLDFTAKDCWRNQSLYKSERVYAIIGTAFGLIPIGWILI